LSHRYPGKLEVVHLLSREDRKDQLLNQVFQPENRNEARFLSVGTKEMMHVKDGMLEEINYPCHGMPCLPKYSAAGFIFY
jgi:hypothetical protein